MLDIEIRHGVFAAHGSLIYFSRFSGGNGYTAIHIFAKISAMPLKLLEDLKS
jgi:hypothetical protein